MARETQNVLERLAALLNINGEGTGQTRDVNWSAHAYLWRVERQVARLHSVPAAAPVPAEDLLCIEPQKEILIRNTRQFVLGFPANNALLWGARGTGKSSLVKAMLPAFVGQGLRIVELDRASMAYLPDLLEILAGRSEKFILFCDDLSFGEGDPAYAHLKSLLDGSTAAPPANILLYATSNRRHLVPEKMQENAERTWHDDEIHPGDTEEEKISLSERFGLWLSFYPNTQDDYLAMVHHWVRKLSSSEALDETLRMEALRWALHRGSRSGRVAAQFARHWVGSRLLERDS